MENVGDYLFKRFCSTGLTSIAAPMVFLLLTQLTGEGPDFKAMSPVLPSEIDYSLMVVRTL